MNGEAFQPHEIPLCCLVVFSSCCSGYFNGKDFIIEAWWLVYEKIISHNYLKQQIKDSFLKQEVTIVLFRSTIFWHINDFFFTKSLHLFKKRNMHVDNVETAGRIRAFTLQIPNIWLPFLKEMTYTENCTHHGLFHLFWLIRHVLKWLCGQVDIIFLTASHLCQGIPLYTVMLRECTSSHRSHHSHISGKYKT